MIANYHTHTTRCNHAHGTDREYIEGAIHAGLKILGFADHSPYYFDTDHYSFYRMKPWEVEEYTSSLLALKEEYKNDIEILIGYEMEYYPKFFERALEMITPYPCDYLILGQHFMGNEIDEGAVHTMSPMTDPPTQTKRFVDQLIEGMNTGKFSYIAHPDVLQYHEDQEYYKPEFRRLCEAAKEAGIPLELNLLGIYSGRWYPHESFFKIAGEVGNEIIIGFDAHGPDMFYQTSYFEKANQIIENCKLNVIEKLTLIDPKK